jgi:hypothetical protein
MLQLQVTIGELASYPVPDDPPDERIFTDEDPGVEPPALVRGRRPAVPGPDVSPDRVCAFEFVVDESGDVRHIQMFSMSNRLDHRMMMAAIKAWKFRPATRQGVPSSSEPEFGLARGPRRMPLSRRQPVTAAFNHPSVLTIRSERRMR